MPKAAAHFLSFVLVLGAIVLAQQFRQSGHRHYSAGIGVSGTAEPAAAQVDGLSVYFSPRGGCEAAVVRVIGQAQRTIDMQAYGFTSSAIAQALVEAKDRGVVVRAVLDREATRGNDVQAVFIQQHGISVLTDGDHPIAHNKVIIIDGETIITGSFNFTRQAENLNAENLLVVRDHPAIASAYERNFEHHLSHSQDFTGAIQPAYHDSSRREHDH